MAFGEPHTHFIHFRGCGHTEPKYVFLPDPKNPARCICSRVDDFKISITNASGVYYTQQRREISACCDDCGLRPKITIEEYEAFLLSALEDEGGEPEKQEGKALPTSPSKKKKLC
ncbi:hypothetical protein TWF718_005473 [Orbilia javanica]|uniref:Uncharacterized protein n=1 Tax=Orbilia javanica TaxID=47235 RepID=A0AAN8RIV7_9PEZI